MIPVRANADAKDLPLVTWTISALLIIIFIWDRHANIFAPSSTFTDLAMRPQLILSSLMPGGDRFALVTLLTSLFLHGSILHIVGNLIFLLVFGPLVEDAFGSPRFTLYYVVWGVISGLTQVFVNPHSMVPTIGASGAIAGVLGSYFLLYPSTKIEILVPLLAFLDFTAPAWVLLGLWFLYQIFIPQQGVANWAHVGGFLVGMMTVLLKGGRTKIISVREQELPKDLYT